MEPPNQKKSKFSEKNLVLKNIVLNFFKNLCKKYKKSVLVLKILVLKNNPR